MGDTLEDIDVETEQKDNKIELLEKKIGLPDCKVIEEMNRLVIKKISSKRKVDRVLGRFNNSLNNQKYNKIKKTKKLNF